MSAPELGARGLRAKDWARGAGLWALLMAEALLFAGLMFPIAALAQMGGAIFWAALRAALNRCGSAGRRQRSLIAQALSQFAGVHNWSRAKAAPWEMSWAGAVKAQETIKRALIGRWLHRWVINAAARALIDRPELGGFASKAGWNPIELIRSSDRGSERLFSLIEPLAERFWRAPVGWSAALRRIEDPRRSARDMAAERQLFSEALRRDEMEAMDALAEARAEASELARAMAPARLSPPAGKKSRGL